MSELSTWEHSRKEEGSQLLDHSDHLKGSYFWKPCHSMQDKGQKKSQVHALGQLVQENEERGMGFQTGVRFPDSSSPAEL